MAKIELTAGVGAMIVTLAQAKGVDVDRLCADTAFAPAVASDPDARISLELEETLWNVAARRSGDDAFGLHAAEVVQPGVFDVLDYVVRCAPTLRASLERLARYNRLVHDAAVFTLIERGDATRIEHAFQIGGATQCRHSADFTLASLVVIGCQIAGRPLRPRAVEFRHARPASQAAWAEYVRVFGLEPSFAQPVNAITFATSELARPAPASDPALSRVVERHAEALLAARPSPVASTADRARRILATTLGEGDATLAAVAAKLHMSERSLQRKLADEGLTFDALLDELRRDLALRYLADPKIAVAEVAYLLGYSEPSPFHRAFKRWTGVTPTEARRRAA